MFHRFEYEKEFYPELSRLPLYARMKLDLAGIKLSLQQWLAFPFEERRVICHLPVDSDEERQNFVEYINFLCHNHLGSPVRMLPPMNPALWNSPQEIPDPVLESSKEGAPAITLAEWTRWQFHERYALYKTAVSKNEPEKFLAVLLELRQRKPES
jgi:hypothetical protein